MRLPYYRNLAEVTVRGVPPEAILPCGGRCDLGHLDPLDRPNCHTSACLIASVDFQKGLHPPDPSRILRAILPLEA